MCPTSLNTTVCSEIAIAHAIGVVELLLRECQKNFLSCSRGVDELFRRWLSDAEQFEIAWSAPVAGALEAYSGRRSFSEAIVELALHLSASGIPGDWDAQVSTDRQFLWKHCVLQTSKFVGIVSDGRKATVCSEGFSGKFSSESLGAVPVVPTFGLTKRIGTIGEAVLSREFLTSDIKFARSPVSSAEPESAEQLQEALSYIDKYAGIYRLWVEFILNDVLILENAPNKFYSASRMDAPGLISMSRVSDVTLLAEGLVHECSHQYQHLLLRFGALDDGTDTNLYFSPPVRKDRPINRILIAYHAFGNVALFYKSCIDRNAPGADMLKIRARTLRSELAVLEEPLRHTCALTPLGRDLFEPLRDQLHEN